MTDKVHRFVTIEQVVRATQPESTDLPTLFKLWGLTDATQESIWAIALDNMDSVKTVTEMAKGGFHDVVVYPANILAAVLASQTDRFYIAHNHPSGPVTPTAEDLQLTADVMAAANVAGLSFEDHLITGPAGLFSFFEAGLIQRASGLGLKTALKTSRVKAANR